LLDKATPEGDAAPTKKIKLTALGENGRNILFLVNDTQNKFLAENQMKLLSDLLNACKISMEDIVLVNYDQNRSVSYRDLTEKFESKKILIFGVTAADLELPFTIPFFQIQKYQEQTYLICPSLSDFSDNVSLKKELWNCLKKIFLTGK
jgi:DNA polymerase III psi subunit